MTQSELAELHDTLIDTLHFLKYYSDSPKELDARVEEQLKIVEKHIETQKESNV